MFESVSCQSNGAVIRRADDITTIAVISAVLSGGRLDEICDRIRRLARKPERLSDG